MAPTPMRSRARERRSARKTRPSAALIFFPSMSNGVERNETEALYPSPGSAVSGPLTGDNAAYCGTTEEGSLNGGILVEFRHNPKLNQVLNMKWLGIVLVLFSER